MYVLTVSEHIKYVGECEKFSSRFNMGYGNISPRNCFENGQETNCRINNLVYLAAVARNDILLWFFPTADHKNVEAELRASLRPPWNRLSDSVLREVSVTFAKEKPDRVSASSGDRDNRRRDGAEDSGGSQALSVSPGCDA